MSGTLIHTLKDLLIPHGQDIRCFLQNVNQKKEKGQRVAVKTSSFCPQLFKQTRLPTSAHLCEDLPIKILEDLAFILDHLYPDQVARTSFINVLGDNVTPNDLFASLRRGCALQAFSFNYESGPKALLQSLSHFVHDIYHALTGKTLSYEAEQSVGWRQVITDGTYEVNNRVHILVEAKSPRVFNRFIGELIHQMRDGSPAQLCVGSKPSKYCGYKAILSKVCVVASVSCLSGTHAISTF
jgi:hypothetical protein